MLGVAPTAPAADIKRAYRQLVVRYHPDKHGGDPRYEEQFKAVALAYGVLGDPGRRARYDFQLTQTARQAEEQRRRQQYRPATQHVYGVPMPPPAPLRTRPPAGSRERHYQRIPTIRRRFTRRDWLLTALLLLGVLLFGISVKMTADHLALTRSYERGLHAYGHGRWAEAEAAMAEALAEEPNFVPALRRQGELAQFIRHDLPAAQASYRAALAHTASARQAAGLWLRLGECAAGLGQPDSAEQHFGRALALNPRLGAAYLARAELRLFRPGPLAAALADFDEGLRQQQAQQQPQGWAYWHAVQLRGVTAARLGRYAEAEADYRRVLAASPRDGRTHFLLGKLAEHSGDSAAACGYYRRAVALGYRFAQRARQRCP